MAGDCMSINTNQPSKTKKQAQREERLKRERQKRLRLILSIVGGAVLIVLAIVAIRSLAAPSATEIVQVTPKTRPQTERNNVGDPNAPVKIVEFSDFQCPYCKQFADNTEQTIIDTFVSSGKVYFTYRSMGNFVSQNIGKGGTESRASAEAAYCAADQGKFWEYKDSLFVNWLGEDIGSYTTARLAAMAESLGLDVEQFRNCLSDKKYRDQVEQDYQDGIAAGVTGTPSFLINGKLIVGAQPIGTFQQEIEAALQAAGN